MPFAYQWFDSNVFSRKSVTAAALPDQANKAKLMDVANNVFFIKFIVKSLQTGMLYVLVKVRDSMDV